LGIRRASELHHVPCFIARPRAREAGPHCDASTKSGVVIGQLDLLGAVHIRRSEASYVTGSELVVDGGYTAQ
jgi:hypothetical protein